jgi:rhamnose utilization protein RhaD (predicted bifunctional aldolase and dehydrogenase)
MLALVDTVADSVYEQLIWLAHEVGREARDLVILNEGSVSGKLGPERLAVKASGAALGTLKPDQLVECDLKRTSDILEKSFLNPAELEAELMGARIDPEAPKPSAEAAFHAWLLTLEDVEFIAHAHPVAINQILCSPQAEPFATQRMFPDQVYRCGPSSVYVPYADPGIPLAREIRGKVLLSLRRSYGKPPKLILLQNHGIIALGKNASDVLATLLMAEKAAAIFIGSAILGGPVFMQQHQVQRLDPRADDGLRPRTPPPPRA